ncbi:hypothetical protein MSAN_02521900 [Mycena sanguinolenta]|uniref:MYND-type domain-containing protein n=1 Tax=Mycena sanguinolenta TaxID=230812 RepID=A0A8H6TZ51_9AGAR|nr:hypothetical protein MSAN_02521900 [Mycena sanguinolenta]
MNTLWNITPESLVTWVGVLNVDGSRDSPEARSASLKAQLGILQSKPMAFQMKIYSEVAAKYLPSLVDLFRQRPEALGSVTTLMNVLTTTYVPLPYVQDHPHHAFLRVQVLLLYKLSAVASSDKEISAMNADEVGEVGQWLWTLLLLQGVQDVAEEDKTILLQNLPIWGRKFPGRLASDTTGRCQALLNDDPSVLFYSAQILPPLSLHFSAMRPMMQGMKIMLESKLDKCGGPGCTRKVQVDGSDLSQCGRCKSAVYCGVAHQKAAWATHKPNCFAPAF